MGTDDLPENWPIKAGHFGGSTAANLAHDLRNVLTVMAGCLDSLASEIPQGWTTTAYLTDLRCALDCASQIASELLGLGQVQSVDHPVIGINQTVADIGGMLGRFLGPRIEFGLSLAAKPDTVVIHPLELERVLVNLILNAREAMQDGGRLTIETTTLGPVSPEVQKPDAPASAFVRLTVSDTGHGIAPAIQAKVFEAFFTTKEKPAGLGLGSVAHTVHGLNGVIHFESQEGIGTRVHVDLPLALEGPAARS
jgi:signal transduction histidine kinase